MTLELKFNSFNDFLILEGSAGTKNDYHIAKVNLDKEKLLFSTTSSFVSELPIAVIRFDEIQKTPIIAKILFTISNKIYEKMQFYFNEVTKNAVRLYFPSRKA